MKVARFALPAFLLVAGCVIVTNSPDDDDSATDDSGGTQPSGTLACGDPDTFSFEDGAGNCVCEDGLVWCIDDPDDFTCCVPACGDPGTNSEQVGTDECACLEGFVWCTEDEQDVTCCAA